MQGIHIIAMGKAIPRKKVSNDELSRHLDTSDEWIREKTGIVQRYFCTEETNLSLALSAAEEAIKRAESKVKNCKQRIRVVLVATATSDYAVPSLACLLQDGLTLPGSLLALDLNAACSGFVYGLQVARALLQTRTSELESGEKPLALVVGSEKLSSILDFQDRSSCVIFGDGAGAAIVELQEGGLYDEISSCQGDAANLVCERKQEPAYLSMQGSAVFRNAVRSMGNTLKELLDRNRLSLEEIRYVVCHQANLRIIDYLRKQYPGYEDKFPINIERYGNTSAASIPILLTELWEEGRLQKGDQLVLLSFGAGFTWGGLLLTI